MTAKDLQLIQEYAPQLNGVLTQADLKTLFSGQSEAALYKKLTSFINEKVLLKVRRGVYALPSAALETISSRICPSAYLSMGTVLAGALVIGSIPARRIQAVRVGWPRTYTCAQGTIEHLSVKPELYFGFEPQNGVLMATPEKAFLDMCYFMLKGRTFSFDPVEDVSLERLDLGRVRDYLEAYDQRFRSWLVKTWGL